MTASGGSGLGESSSGTRRHEKPAGGVAGVHAPPPEGGAKALLGRARPLDAVIGGIVIAILVTLWLPGYWESQRIAREESALAFVREVAQLQATFRAQKGGGVRHASSFFELAAAGVYQGTAPEGAAVERDGYVVRLATLDAEGMRWYAMATPVRFGATGSRSFFVDDTGKVRAASAPVAGPAFPEAP